MSAPRLLDLFCGAGGAGAGYARAGFEVVGVDIKPQRNYPFEFHQADALDFLFRHGDGFDAIHASPPCLRHSQMTKRHAGRAETHPELIGPTRDLLIAVEVPWVIENVPGAPVRADYRLCGCRFGLPGLRRERWFETSWGGFEMQPPHRHNDRTITVCGHPGGSSTRGHEGFGNKADWCRAMGIDWMTARELAQAIPPAYTEHIGLKLLAAIEEAAA